MSNENNSIYTNENVDLSRRASTIRSEEINSTTSCLRKAGNTQSKVLDKNLIPLSKKKSTNKVNNNSLIESRALIKKTIKDTTKSLTNVLSSIKEEVPIRKNTQKLKTIKKKVNKHLIDGFKLKLLSKLLKAEHNLRAKTKKKLNGKLYYFKKRRLKRDDIKRSLNAIDDHKAMANKITKLDNEIRKSKLVVPNRGSNAVEKKKDF